jgi:hypothetical protein
VKGREPYCHKNIEVIKKLFRSLPTPLFLRVSKVFCSVSDPRLSVFIRRKILHYPVTRDFGDLAAIPNFLRCLRSSVFQGFGLGRISVISVDQW